MVLLFLISAGRDIKHFGVPNDTVANWSIAHVVMQAYDLGTLRQRFYTDLEL